MTDVSPMSAGPGGGGLVGLGGVRFYRHSGRAPVNALMAGILAGVIGGLVLGAAWGFVELYLHLAPTKLMVAGMVFGLLGLGWGLGWIPVAAMMRFKGRSPMGTAVCVMAGLAAAFYAAWVFFIFALSLYQSEGSLPLWAFLSPVTIWRVHAGVL